MFLVGTALLTFGMGLYVMFAASSGKNQKNGERHPVAESNFGPFNLKVRINFPIFYLNLVWKKNKIKSTL